MHLAAFSEKFDQAPSPLWFVRGEGVGGERYSNPIPKKSAPCLPPFHNARSKP